LIDDEERWKSYIKDSLIETSISKDILMLTRVDKPALLKRLFELGCLYSGQILSYAIVNPKLWGRLVESPVEAHLLNHAVSERYNLFYWREGNNEVDFILEKGNKVIGLEVKSGASADNAGMGIFNEKFHPDKMLLVGTGGISYEEFLKINPKDIF
jgi:Predicted ATPase (AAA+ superfamily)